MNKEKAPCTIIIIAVNVTVFLVLSFWGVTEEANFMLQHGAMYAPKLIEGQEYYRFLTSMFLHFGIEHLTNNMLLLGIMGWQLELEVGSVKFLIMYLLSGVGGTMLSVWSSLQINEFAVSAGASGAIFGIIGALLYIAIRSRGKMGRLTTKKLLFMILLSLYFGFTSTGVDNMAHIGGLIAGFLLAVLLYRKHNSERGSHVRY